jgi:hypothetical protein
MAEQSTETQTPTATVTEQKPSLVTEGTKTEVAQTPEQIAAAATEAARVAALTPEQKATEEAAAKAKADEEAKAKVETPEQKVAREKTESDDKANNTKTNPLKAEELKFPEGITATPEQSGSLVEIVNKYGIDRRAVNELLALQGNVAKSGSEALPQRGTHCRLNGKTSLKLIRFSAVTSLLAI